MPNAPDLHKTWILKLFILLFLSSCSQEVDKQIVGVKIYSHQGSLEKLFREWDELGINTLFCGEDLIADRAFMKAAQSHGKTTFLIFPVFFNAEELARSPHYRALTAEGEAAIEEWVEFVCPSREEYREQMVDKAQKAVRDHRPDGISIDFIRHFVFWEKVFPERDPSTLPQSCFDSLCLNHFHTETGIGLPDSLLTIPQQAQWILKNHPEEWTDWRCGQITSMVKEIAWAVREIDPGIGINVHLVPWTEQDFDGAIQRVAGQDIAALSAYTDYLSPMTYAHMVKQPPRWIHSVVKDISRQGNGRVIPSIQVNKAYLDHDLGVDEFEQSVIEALKPPSGGVVFWSWERVADDSEKKEIIRTYCAQ